MAEERADDLDVRPRIVTQCEGGHNFARRNDFDNLHADRLQDCLTELCRHSRAAASVYINAELSDFFYVWEKLLLADVYPDLYADALTDKVDEAVSNPARFKKVGDTTSSEQARRFYETKMKAVFQEVHRVLRPAGVFTLMFTHKSVDAWDALAAALVQTGFEITASWPVHTESEHSLHQAKKNACESTILLACRKRESTASRGAWWDDLVGEVRRTARAKAAEFEAKGMEGVDLYIATFGPTLQILSANWPVKRESGDLLRPEQALEAAREEVTNLRIRRLLATGSARFDRPTEFAVLWWDVFRAAEVRYDEALKLGRSVGVDVDDLRNRMALLLKNGNYVRMLPPAERRRRKPSQLDPEATTFEAAINAIETAMYVHQEDGPNGLRAFLRSTGLAQSPSFTGAIEALLKAIPQTKATKDFFQPLYEMANTGLAGKVKLPQLELNLDGSGASAEESDNGEDEG